MPNFYLLDYKRFANSPICSMCMIIGHRCQGIRHDSFKWLYSLLYSQQRNIQTMRVKFHEIHQKSRGILSWYIKTCSDQRINILLGAYYFPPTSAGFSTEQERLLLVTSILFSWSPRKYSLGSGCSRPCRRLHYDDGNFYRQIHFPIRHLSTIYLYEN